MISSRPAPANRRWRKRKIGFAIPTKRVARNEHHAAMGRLVLVLPAILRSAERRSVSSAKKRSATGWAEERLECEWRPHNPGGVDLYVGGTEHAVLHLLYARFWHKVLFDLGYVSTPEPFQRLVNQGMILGEDSQKMSKRWGNVINPDDVIEIYGADAFRCYEMFMGPLEQMKPWSMRGVEGVSRFLARVWRLIMEENQAGEWVLSAAVQEVEPTKAQLKIIHATIKKVTEDIETLSFNTAISQMMIFVNAFTNAGQIRFRDAHLPGSAQSVRAASHFGILGNAEREVHRRARRHHRTDLAELRRTFLVEDEVEIVVQVNGKLRDKIDCRARRDGRGTRSGRARQPKSSERRRRQDYSQGRRRAEKACERRRELSRTAAYVEGIQRVRRQR